MSDRKRTHVSSTMICNVPPRRRPAGFSLVELLVVIAIIAVLMGILLPVLARARQAAARAACASNLRQIGQLLYAYAGDNRGELPAAYGGPARADVWGRPVSSYHAYVVAPWWGGISLLVPPPIGTAQQAYVKNADVFFCPNDDMFGRLGDGSFGAFPGWAPGLPATVERAMSYHYLYVPPGGDHHFGRGLTVTPGRHAGLERHSVRQPRASATAVMFDVLNDASGTLAPFHNGAWNALYLDGHVAVVGAPQQKLDAPPDDLLRYAAGMLDHHARSAR